MRSVARRYLTEAAVPIAVGLFALTDWLLYYSVEIKQYSSDVALTLAALLSWVLRPPHTDGTRSISLREWLALAAFGTIGVWFSFPLALVLAGVGSYLIVSAASRKAWYETLALLAMSLGWASSFALCYWVSQSIVSKDSFLANFWDFAFLPFPPRSLRRSRADLLADDQRAQLSVRATHSAGRPGFDVHCAGAVSCWECGRWAEGGREACFLSFRPSCFALVASMLHQYPFHGRLLLFLVPSVHLLVGEGAAVLSRPGGARLTFALGAFLFCQPVLDVLWHRFVAKRNHTEFDSHGDLSHDLLDYLDDIEKIEATRRNDSTGHSRATQGPGSSTGNCHRLKVLIERRASHPERFLGCRADAQAAGLDVGRNRAQAEAFDDLESPLNLGVGLDALGGLASDILGPDRGGSRSKGKPPVARRGSRGSIRR